MAKCWLKQSCSLVESSLFELHCRGVALGLHSSNPSFEVEATGGTRRTQSVADDVDFHPGVQGFRKFLGDFTKTE
ncbi:MAG: hypothetical protein JWL90_2957 [Chthoniobacteraceae bacterium]|nr:hypothetical protein [Chthoniobacteraceae bacterium]